ncbi:MAG TPA: M1 family peptidase, partial [bacterium]
MAIKKFSNLFWWLVVMFFLTFHLEAQPVIFKTPLSPRIASYDIDVRLDAEKNLLHGAEKLTWFNKSQDRITELQFHLYLNAFRNTKSTFMIESGGSHRGYKIDDDGWGFIEVDKILLSSGEDLTDQLEFIHPDNDDLEDKTVIRVPLPRPLLPGRSITLDIDFTAKLPEPPFARTGTKKEYFFVGQWFPKIGVNIDGAWNCHQFHRNSEFFADFGVYDVHITVPKENIVGATGIEVEVTDNDDGTATHFYHAEDVHDSALTTSPELIEVTGKSQDVDIRV